MRSSPLRFVLPLVLAASLAIAPAATAAPVGESRVGGTGAPLYAIQDGRLARVWLDVHLEAGERFVPAAQSGLSWLAAEVLNRGPADMPYAQYRQTLFRQGAEITWEASNRFLTAHVKCRPEQLGAVAALVARTARQPRLEEFTTLHPLVLDQRRALSDDMRALTFHYGKQKAWDFRPESRLPEGWVSSLARVTRGDLSTFLRRLERPAAFVSAAGPVTEARLAQSLAPAFEGWARPFAPSRSRAPGPGSRRVVIVDRPGATDNQIYAVAPASVELTAKEAAALEVFLTGMGGGLGARLGRTLRVVRGLTYHAGSGLRRVEWPSWYVYTFGGVEQTPKLVAGVFELFEAARGGLSPDEVEQARQQLIKGAAFGAESPPEQIAEVAAAIGQGLPASYPADRLAGLQRVTAGDVADAARRVAGLPGATIVLMGDASKLKPAIEGVLPRGTELTVKTLEQLDAEALH